MMLRLPVVSIGILRMWLFWNNGKGMVVRMRMNLKKKILSVAVLPILLLGTVTILIALTQIKNSLINEVKDSLRGTAAATLAAYDQNAGNYLRAENYFLFFFTFYTMR